MLNVSRAAFAAALLFSLSGCVVTNAARLGGGTANRPPVDPQNVALYRVASQVPGRYEEVALLNSKGDSNFTDEARMFESMRKKAGQVGANGVILDAVSEPGHGAKVAAAIFGVSAQRKGSALAIWVFPQEAGAIASAGAAVTSAVAVSPENLQTPNAADTQEREQDSAQRHEPDPSKRCDACRRIGSP